MRLRQSLKAAPVWIMDETGVWIPGEVDLAEGWYALPDDGTDEP